LEIDVSERGNREARSIGRNTNATHISDIYVKNKTVAARRMLATRAAVVI